LACFSATKEQPSVFCPSGTKTIHHPVQPPNALT
jgi:hypothetical protein